MEKLVMSAVSAATEMVVISSITVTATAATKSAKAMTEAWQKLAGDVKLDINISGVSIVFKMGVSSASAQASVFTLASLLEMLLQIATTAAHMRNKTVAITILHKTVASIIVMGIIVCYYGGSTKVYHYLDYDADNC